jgi:Amt family ammonium transporter
MSSSSTYETCLADLSASSSATPSTEDLLICISNSFDESQTSTDSAVNVFYLLYAASLVFLMQAGFAMIAAGCVRLTNVQNTLLKNLLDACGAALGFYSVGYAFAWGGSTDASTTDVTFIG